MVRILKKLSLIWIVGMLIYILSIVICEYISTPDDTVNAVKALFYAGGWVAGSIVVLIQTIIAEF